MLQTWQATEENHDESMSLQQAQFELSREQFEYQKQQDKNNQNMQGQAEKEPEEIKRQNQLNKQNQYKTPSLKATAVISLVPVAAAKNTKNAMRTVIFNRLNLQAVNHSCTKNGEPFSNTVMRARV